MNKKELWFSKEAKVWAEALPLGNGSMGAMVSGGCDVETVYLNEDTFVAGTVYQDDNAPFENIKKIRQLVLEGKQPEADKLMEATMSNPINTYAYQPLSTVHIDFGHKNVTDYRRSLDLENAVTYTDYVSCGTKYSREAFISMNKDLMVYKIVSDKENALSFTINTDAPIMHYSFTGEDRLTTVTKCPDDNWPECVYTDYAGVTGVTMIKIVSDGEVLYKDNKAQVLRATKAEIYIACATSFISFDKKPDADAIGICEDILSEIPDYDSFKNEHIKEYRKYFDRVDFCLGEAKNLPTDERIKGIINAPDSDLVSLFFHYGRYLQIASSAPGSVAVNLQGIWNHLPKPMWQCSYTLDINVEMCYWLAEFGNLSECHMPLFDLIRSFSENGKICASQYFGCNGWCTRPNADLWVVAGPFMDYEGSSQGGLWNMAGMWLCLHIFEHFRYTGDLEFLKSNFDVVEGAVTFVEDWMFMHEGKYITCPSTSPENCYLNEEGKPSCSSYSSTMDIALVKECFSEYIRLAELLEKDGKLVDKAKEILSNMHDYQIGSDGRLMEYIKEYGETEPGHRHLSHLFGVFPGTTITEDTPELFEAARKSLDTRVASGGGHTGWSAAWITNLYASFFDGEKAIGFLKKLIGTSTLPNMFNTDPSIDPLPFQIDGNLGGAVAIARMIMQNAYGKIRLLPALPKEWESGKMTGLRAEGGFTVDVLWNDNKLDFAKITADRDNTCNLYGTYTVECDGKEISVKTQDGITTFDAQAGKTYIIR